MSEKKDDNWEMPQPVFKSSEGSLPRSLEETILTSFMANAETIEIDEDDDILGIMDDSYFNRPLVPAHQPDEEPILEALPEVEPETASQIDATKNEKPIVDTQPTSAPAEATQRVSVIAKETSERATAATGGVGPNFFILSIAVLIVIAAVSAYFLFFTK